jgi:RNA polymerase sigma-70 factor, ECF subfamily
MIRWKALFRDDKKNRLLAERRFRLFRTALAWCGSRDLAEDLTQEAMMNAATSWNSLRDPARLDAWLFSILANCWRMHLRSRRTFEPLDELAEEFLIDERSTEAIHETREIVDRVRIAVAALPILHREVVTLVDLEDFSYVEVARILGIPAGTVMSRLARGRSALKVVLERQSLPPGNAKGD